MRRWLFSVSNDDGFRELQDLFFNMLRDGKAIFETASDLLFGLREVEDVRSYLFETDARINAAEHELRRRIVVHGTVHGQGTFPSLLVLMSVAKDAERIGDYAKNLFDLAALRPDFGVELKTLRILRHDIVALLERAWRVYGSEDEEAAKSCLEEADRLQDACDQLLDECLVVKGRNCAPQVLAARHFKRVTSHTANVMTSMVMPLDKLDFHDEP